MAYTNVYFTADFSSDGIEQGEGDDWEVVRPSGMAMASAIADLLRGSGLPVTDPEPDIEHYCWVMAVGKDSKLFWVRVYDIDEDERGIQIQGPTPFLKRLLNRRDPYQDLLKLISSLLSNDIRFKDLRWEDLHGKPISPT